MAEERLIHDMIGRASQRMPHRREKEPKPLTEELESYSTSPEFASLLKWADHHPNIVVGGLVQLYDSIQKERVDTVIQATCQFISTYLILFTIKRVFCTDDEKPKKLSFLLSESTATFIVDRMVMPFLLQPNSVSHGSELQLIAGRLLYWLSNEHANIVMPRISQKFVAMNASDEEETANSLHLISNVRLHTASLAEIISIMVKIAPILKKPGQAYMARALRAAIWDWVDCQPAEFVDLCRSGKRINDSARLLFELVSGWADSNKRRAIMWPLQTMLLILCPEIFYAAAMPGQNKKQEFPKASHFMELLEKNFKAKSLADVAAVCFVDIVRASTFVSRDTESGLRFFVPTIEVNLKDRLFNKQKLFVPSAENKIDVKELMVHASIAFYRLNPRAVVGSNGLFSQFLASDAPPLFRIVLAESLLHISTHEVEASLEWNPDIQQAYGLSARIRTLFGELSALDRNEDSLRKGQDPKADKKIRLAAEAMQLEMDALTTLMTLIQIDPKVVLTTFESKMENVRRQVRILLTSLCSLLVDVGKVPEVAANTLIELNAPKNIEIWSPKDVMGGYWEISSAVSIEFSKILSEIEHEKAGFILNVFEEILRRRHNFITLHAKSMKAAFDVAKKFNAEIGFTKERNEANQWMEGSLLLLLSSCESDVVSKVCTCFGLLCDEVDLLRMADDPYYDADNMSIAANYEVFQQISTAGILSTGRAAQQKMVRRLLRSMDVQTPGNFMAWNMAYSKWLGHTKMFLTEETLPSSKSKDTKPSFRQKVETEITEARSTWHNATGLLCATASVVLKDESAQKAPESNVEEFFDYVIQLMTCGHEFVREAVISIVASDTSPLAFPAIFKRILDLVSSLDAASTVVAEEERRKIEQMIQLVRRILDRPLSQTDELRRVDFETLVLGFIRFINHLEKSPESLRIKHKACNLVDVLMSKVDFVGIRDINKFRHGLLDEVMEWTSEFAVTGRQKEEGLGKLFEEAKDRRHTEYKDDVTKMQKDLDVIALKAIASILDGLPFRSEKSHDAEDGDEDAGSRRFFQVFRFLGAVFYYP